MMDNNLPNDGNLRKVVIVGRDAAAWLSAVVVKNALAVYDIQVTVVELPTELCEADIYTSLPPLEGLHKLLEIDEWDLLRHTDGLFSLGQAYSGFQKDGSEFFFPFGEHGVRIGDQPFIDHWVKAKANGLSIQLEQFSLNAAAARALKFFKPDPRTASLHQTDYAYHLNALGYTLFLKQLAQKVGVELMTSSSLKVRIDSDSGDLTDVILDSGNLVEGDLFVDASGHDSLLVSKAMSAPKKSWNGYFPFTRRLSIKTPKLSQLPAYSKIMATKIGIGRLAALQTYTGFHFAFDPKRTSADEAVQTALILGNAAPESQVSFLDMPPGYRTPWTSNVVGIGASSASLDPISGTELHLIHIGLMHFLAAITSNLPVEQKRSQFNQTMINAVEDCRDFEFTKYKLNRLDDGGIWELLGKTPAPTELQRKIEEFAEGAPLTITHNATYSPHDWAAMFVGCGFIPNKLNPNLEKFDEQLVMQEFKKILELISQSVESMPALNAYFDDL